VTRLRARATTIATLLAVLAAATPVRADQPAGAPPAEAPPAEAPPPEAPPAEAPSAAAPSAAVDPAWGTYDRAFAELGKGDRVEARADLLELTTRWPGHPAAGQAALRLAQIDARAAVRRTRGTSANRVARGEVVFWSTAGSVLIARDLCIDNCSSDRESAAVYSLAVGAALGVSLLATRHGVEPAEAQLYNASQTWGSWNALAINDGFADNEQEAAISIGAQFGGLAAGLGLWRVWRPSPGEVALANSGLLWGAVLSLYGHLLADDEPSMTTVVALGDVGLITGALIAHQVPMSRGRTLLIDLGGVLGTLAGGLISFSADDAQTAGGILFTTTAAGLVIAGIATRGWDVKAPGSMRVVPARVGTPGAGASWGAAVAFDL